MSDSYPDNAEYNKLVRDFIPEIIKAQGLQVESRQLNDVKIVSELLNKAVEEAHELRKAEGKEEITKEMSDVLEVLNSLADRLGIDMEEVERLRQVRASKRGRFEKGTFLVRTFREE